MRLLLLTPFAPDIQATHGGGAYLGHLLVELGRLAEVGVVAQVAPAEAERWAAASRDWAFARAVPFVARPGGLARVPHTLAMLWRWRQLPLVAAKHHDAAVARALTAAVRDFRPDAVLVELAQMAQYLPVLRGVPTVLTDHEAGCPANTTTGLGAAGDRRDRALWRRFVQRFYPLADLVQAVTPEDAATLHTLLGRPVAVRPPVVAMPDAPTDPGAAPPRALFLGDYRHGPNVEAANRLAHEVWPHVRAAVPAAELWLAGPHGERLAVAAAPGVRVLGFAPDLGGLFAQVRLLLAPVWSGGGFRMKGMTALAHGLPVVTNGLGARGCAAPAAARVVAEQPRDLAAAAVVWLRDAAAARDAGRAAFAWVHEHVAGAAVATAQLQRVRELLARRR